MTTQKTQVWIKKKYNKPFYETGELIKITNTEIKVKDYETKEVITYDRSLFYALYYAGKTIKNVEDLKNAYQINQKKEGIKTPSSHSK